MIAPFFGCAAIAASIIPFLNGSLQWLEAVAIGMIIVQACDAAIGVTIQDRMKTFGREELLLPLMTPLTARTPQRKESS
jgi:hypothetical protein